MKRKIIWKKIEHLFLYALLGVLFNLFLIEDDSIGHWIIIGIIAFTDLFLKKKKYLTNLSVRDNKFHFYWIDNLLRGKELYIDLYDTSNVTIKEKYFLTRDTNELQIKGPKRKLSFKLIDKNLNDKVRALISERVTKSN